MSELETLHPEGVTVKAGGEEVHLKPFTFGQLVKVTKHLKPIVGALKASGIWATEKRGAETVFKLAEDWPLKAVDAIAEGGDHLMDFLEFATGKSRAWLDGLESDAGIALAKGVFEVNADFFGRKIIPLLQPLPPDGQTSSPSSSPADIPDPTLMATPSDSSSSTQPEPSATVGA